MLKLSGTSQLATIFFVNLPFWDTLGHGAIHANNNTQKYTHKYQCPHFEKAFGCGKNWKAFLGLLIFAFTNHQKKKPKMA